MRNVIGSDLSTPPTGICRPDGTTLTVGGPAHGDRRLLDITRAVIRVHMAPPLDLAVIEDLPVHGKAAGITGMVHGAVRYALQRLGVPYALLSPATLKAYATGKGSADKAAMTLAAYKRAGREVADDNQVDAWWLRAAGLDWLGTPEIEMPGAQRARLDKAKWPTPAGKELTR